jgi:hypothetical protein
VIVPFPPGIVDGYARFVATKASAMLGQPMVVKNQAGAGQRIGTDALAKAAPDGYTIGVITNAGVVSGPVLANGALRPGQGPVLPDDELRDPLPGEHPSRLGHQDGCSSCRIRPRHRPARSQFGSTGMGTGFHLAIEQFRTMRRHQDAARAVQAAKAR